MEQISPHDLDAERAVLGCMLLSESAVHEVLDILERGDFYYAPHTILFDSIVKLVREGNKADAVTVATDLNESGLLEQINGPMYIGTVLETVPHANHAMDYAKTVVTLSRKRQFIDACRLGITEAQGSRDLVEVAADTEQKLHDVIAYRGETGIESIRDAVEEIFARLDRQEPPGMDTGFSDLDKIITLQPGHLILIAGRPGMGKTGFAGNISLNIARQGKRVLFFSLEQTTLELTERLWASYSGVDHLKIAGRDHLDDEDRDTLMQTAGEFAQLPIDIDSDPSTSILRIASKARRWKRQHGLDLLVIDYLQLIEPEDRRIPREQQVAVMSRTMKKLAMQLEVPVICLAQLNRLLEQRPDKKPRLSDLRESGSLEQDANIVLFTHRPEYYDSEDRPGEADIIVAKNRSGTVGDVKLQWEGRIVTFRDLAYRMPTENHWPTDDEYDMFS